MSFFVDSNKSFRLFAHSFAIHKAPHTASISIHGRAEDTFAENYALESSFSIAVGRLHFTMQTDEYCGDIYSCSLRLGPMKILKNYVVPICIFFLLGSFPSIRQFTRKQPAPIVVDALLNGLEMGDFKKLYKDGKKDCNLNLYTERK